MMNFKLILSTAAVAAALISAPLGFQSAQANEFADQLNALAQGEIKTWLASPEVISAVKAQNAEHASIDQAKIDSLDKEWRAQAGSGGALVDKVLGNDLSAFLKAKKEASGGLYTEVFVVDNKGLNVGQSDVTSDYWQGDEAKWKVPFNENKVHLGEIEQDESTQAFQSQINMPVLDGGKPIGTVTIGINLEALE